MPGIARETFDVVVAVFGAEHGRDAFYFPLDDQLRSREEAGKRDFRLSTRNRGGISVRKKLSSTFPPFSRQATFDGLRWDMIFNT